MPWWQCFMSAKDNSESWAWLCEAGEMSFKMRGSDLPEGKPWLSRCQDDHFLSCTTSISRQWWCTPFTTALTVSWSEVQTVRADNGASLESSQGDCDLDSSFTTVQSDSWGSCWPVTGLSDCAMRTTNHTAAIKFLSSFPVRSLLCSFTVYTMVGTRIQMQWKGGFPPQPQVSENFISQLDGFLLTSITESEAPDEHLCCTWVFCLQCHLCWEQ